MAGVTFTLMSLMLVGTGASSAGASGIPTGGTKVSGGTVRWAEPPGTPPTYIFPFMSPQNSSVDNISQFQYLMYRPLYMFGFPGNNKTTLNSTLSLAEQRRSTAAATRRPPSPSSRSTSGPTASR